MAAVLFQIHRELQLEKEHFVEGIDVGGAVTFLTYAKGADVTLTF